MEDDEPVLVYVRIRPENVLEQSSGSGSDFASSQLSPTNSRSSWTSLTQATQQAASRQDFKCAHILDDKTVRITPPDHANGARKSVAAVDDKVFTFDRVFPDDSTQEDIYKSVSEHVKAAVRGYNSTIFAYGSTGSGKSHTMTGNSTAPGIIPRAISEIFSIIEATATQESDIYFYVRISYVELYNNSFRNLLDFASKDLAMRAQQGQEPGSESSYFDSRASGPRSPTHGSGHRNEKIEVRESKVAGVFLDGPPFLRIPVTTAHEAFQLIAKGNKSRAVGSTQCNDVSSR